MVYTFETCNVPNTHQLEQMLALWNYEYPVQLGYQNREAFEQYLAGLGNKKHILLFDPNQTLVGWYLRFKRDQEIWFALIISSSIQGKGMGKKLMDKAKLEEKILNGWVIDHNQDEKADGSPYRSPLGFYIKQQFNVMEDVRLDIEKISAVKIVWSRSN